MARRIEFLAPVEAMRGNLSGKQALKYPTKNNSAWDAPSDQRSYSTNYNTRYIGAKKTANGLKYFAVKQRAAVTNTPAQREAQALLGASKIIADAMIYDITIIQRLYDMYRGYKDHGYNYNPAWIPSDIVPGNAHNSIRRYLMRNIRELTLIPKNKQFVIQPQSGADIVYNNPWRLDQTSGSKVEDIDDQFIKFWKQLGFVSQGETPIYFYVGGVLCVAGSTTDFDIFISSTSTTYAYGMNTIGLVADSNDYVKLGTQFLKYNDAYVTMNDNIVADAKYYLTDIAPA